MTTRISLGAEKVVPASPEPRVAIAFGGGGARGIAHIAVIEALDEMGIRPVAIAGSSIGAIFGTACSGYERRGDPRLYAGDDRHRNAVLNRLWSLGLPACVMALAVFVSGISTSSEYWKRFCLPRSA